MKIQTLTRATVLAVSLIALSSMPTSAAWNYYGSNSVWVGYNNEYIQVCDNESDGHGFYAEYKHYGSSAVQGSVEDYTGGASGCAGVFTGGYINYIRMCEYDWAGTSCTGWIWQAGSA